MSNEKLGEKKFDYKWIIVGLCFLMVCVTLGFCSSSKSLYLKPITEYLQVDRSSYSLNDSMRYIATAFVNLFFGSMIAKFGPKRLILAGMVSLVGSMILYAVAESLVVFYIGGVLLGIGFSWTGTAMVGYVVNIWCKENKGTIMGLILASNGIGAAIAMQIVSPIINASAVGYKSAYWLITIILAVLLVLLLLFFKDKPKEEVATVGVEKKKPKGESWVGMSWDYAVKKWWFYVALICIFFTGFCLQGISGVSAAHMRDVGVNEAFVATVLSAHSIALAFFKFLTGFIYDKLGLRFAVSMCVGVAILIMILLTVISGSTVGMVAAMAYGILSALALPLETIMLPIYASDLFGQKSYGKILGIIVSCNVAGYALGAPIVNLCYDLTGNYNVAFYACAGIMLLVLVGLQMVISAANREKIKITTSLGEVEQDAEVQDGNN